MVHKTRHIHDYIPTPTPGSKKTAKFNQRYTPFTTITKAAAIEKFKAELQTENHIEMKAAKTKDPVFKHRHKGITGAYFGQFEFQKKFVPYNNHSFMKTKTASKGLSMMDRVLLTNMTETWIDQLFKIRKKNCEVIISSI